MKIKEILEQAGLYAKLYDVQIEQTEMAIKELKKMQIIVNKEGRTVEKVTKNGSEMVAHPLLTVINQYHRTITQQLSSLGLNRLKIDVGIVNNDDHVKSLMQEL